MGANTLPSVHSVDFLLEMLRYKRPEGSREQKRFCNRFLRPASGNPDDHGNYTLVIGDDPKIAFMSHHDTVHKQGGKQRVIVRDNVAMLPNGGGMFHRT